MRILFGYRYGILGGVCTQLINRLQLFREREGIEAHLLFSRDYGISKTLEGYPHLYFESDPRSIRSLAAEGGFDAAVVIDTPELFEALEELPLPIVTEVHTTVERGLCYLQNRSWRSAGFIVPSQYSLRLLRERFGVPDSEKIAVVPNCLEEDLFPSVDLPKWPSRPVFAWIGKLDDHKNWRGFLDVASEITARGVECEFWLVGGYTAPAEVERDLIDAMAARGLTARCRWFPRVEYRGMHRLFAAVRQSGGAAIVTSLNESFGMSVLEALICGCPVVASNVGALPEMVPNKPYLRLYESGWAADAADLATSFCGSDGDPVRQALAADRDVLLSTFSSRTISQLYRETLCEIISTAPPRQVNRQTAVMPTPMSSLGSPSSFAGELERAVDRLRAFHPHPEQRSAEPVRFLEHFRALQNHRSYRVARLFASRGSGFGFWLRLPSRLLRLLFSK